MPVPGPFRKCPVPFDFTVMQYKTRLKVFIKETKMPADESNAGMKLKVIPVDVI